jgi:hypothetical protein
MFSESHPPVFNAFGLRVDSGPFLPNLLTNNHVGVTIYRLVSVSYPVDLAV